jgi:syntaxin-binding protein 1
MTYSEMRSAYQLSNQLGKDVYIGEPRVHSNLLHSREPQLTIHGTGSTHTIIPEEFVGDLETLDIGGQGSSSIPSGLPESSKAQQRPFQVYYDQKYMTKDEPPPAPKPAPAPPASPSGLLGLPSRPVISALGLGRSASPSPAASFSSGGGGAGAASETERKEKEKLKKKRFLGF